jgi:hypothetical protein
MSDQVEYDINLFTIVCFIYIILRGKYSRGRCAAISSNHK